MGIVTECRPTCCHPLSRQFVYRDWISGVEPAEAESQLPPCECSICCNQFYSAEKQRLARCSYTAVLDDKEAIAILSEHVEAIKEGQNYLCRAIQQYGDKILGRWRKRSPAKRAELLREIVPNFPQDRGSIVDLEFSGLPWQHVRSRYRTLLLLPSMDIDSLAKNPSALIGLVHYRAGKHPAEWAQFDNEQLGFSWAWGLLDVEYYACGVIMYEQDYGQLIPWEAKLVHEGHVVGFPRGRLIIEAQATLIKSLCSIVKQLLDGVEETEAEPAIKWTELIQGGLRKNAEIESWSDYINQPFSAPPAFNIDILLAHAQARMNATGYHLWLLQTEPSYAKRYLGSVALTQAIQLHQKEPYGNELLTYDVKADVDQHWFWKGVVGELEHLQDVCGRNRSGIRPGIPLPQEVDETLGDLSTLLEKELYERSSRLQVIFGQRPGFQHIYNFTYVPEICASEGRIKDTFTPQLLYRQETLWWCIMQLLGEPNCQDRYHYATILNILDRHLESASAEECSRLDELLYEKLSDYVAIIEVLSAIRMHHPKARSSKDNGAMHASSNRFAGALALARKQDLQCMCQVGEALENLQATALPSGPKDDKCLETFDNAHRALQKVWKEEMYIHDLWFKESAQISSHHVQYAMQALSHWKSSEYHVQLAAKRNEIRKIIESKNKPQDQPSNDLFLPFPSTGKEFSKGHISMPKEKVKTRGERQTLDTVDQTSQPVKLAQSVTHAASIQSSKSVCVNRKLLRIFRSMFPQTTEERQETIDWETFVLAMQHAEFSAKNGGGSIVIFEEMNGSGKIIFHRPHPVPKIDPVMLQSMGRRMHKWFGWMRDTFKVTRK